MELTDIHLAYSVARGNSTEARCTNKGQQPRHFPHHTTSISIDNWMWHTRILQVRKPNSVHRQTVQTAWFEEDILHRVFYLQTTCLLVLTEKKKMWCDVANIFFGTVLDEHNKPLCYFLLLHHNQAEDHVSSVQLKQCKISIHAAKCVSNELNHAALTLHRCLLCSLWLGEGRMSIISLKLCAWLTLHCTEPRQFQIYHISRTIRRTMIFSFDI